MSKGLAEVITVASHSLFPNLKVSTYVSLAVKLITCKRVAYKNI